MFNQQDQTNIEKLGISNEQVLQQLQNFEKGFPFLKIKSAATADQGILRLSDEEQNSFIAKYEDFKGSKTKFVPASGAASRMFKALFEAKDKLEKEESLDFDDPKNHAAKEFFTHLEEFAFFDDLRNYNISTEYETLNSLLTPAGLNYGGIPKGVLKFHKYISFVRTAFEEHLVEAARYAVNAGDSEANVHFTVSEEHMDLFKTLLDKVLENYEKKYGLKYNISFSTQKKSTNTIAVDAENKPFRNADGSILFRPGGHGALLENLNAIHSDIVFIKNIDNVVHESKITDTARWKKVLAGVLVDCREKIFNYLRAFEAGKVSENMLNEISTFMKKNFCVETPKNISTDKLAEFLHAKLNRPIRVCGMVKNQGEPGGGPFVIYENDGSTSLQILESSQINKSDAEAVKILKNSTHFNPVDLVCSFVDYKGEKYNLPDFRDNSTGFISEKSQQGKTLKAQELPGLWNGAMSNWNTAFVEVPLSTFNPVKTVNDLLREKHKM